MAKENFKCELVSWDDAVKLCSELANIILHDQYQADIVVAIARGGYVPARLLCDYLDIYNLASIRITHYTAGAEKSEEARLVSPLNIDVAGLKVLIVDDVDDSGDTLRLAQEHIKVSQPTEARVAVLHHKITSTLVPDYYARTQTDWHWITYPWASVEDIRGFINKMKPRPRTMHEVQQRLQVEYGIKPSREVLDAVARLTP